MEENGYNNKLSNEVSKKNNEPSSFELKIINNRNTSGVMLSFLEPKERAKLLLLKKDTTSINDKLSQVECMHRDKLYADYLHCLNYDHKTLKEIIDNIFKSDLKQLNKKLEKSDEKTQNFFHFDKEREGIMTCMQPYLKIYMCQMILVEIFSLMRDDFDADCVSSDDKISKCIENIIKNKENQQKRIDKILALENNEQIIEAKTFWNRIREIWSDETCKKIKDNSESELRGVMYHSLWLNLLIKEILPEIDQRCDAKYRTVETLQMDIATNQSRVEQYKKELEDLQKKGKYWNEILALVNCNVFKKQKNANENKKSESGQNQPSIENLENKNILSLNNNLAVSLDNPESLIDFCNENMKINKEAQEKVGKEISKGKENIARFKRQITELPVQKGIRETIKDIKEPHKNKLAGVVFSFLLDHPNNINIQVLQIIAKPAYGEDCVYYDDMVDFVSRFTIYSLKHYEHKNFLLAIIESSKILHELLESNYSKEEEKLWRRDYYKCYDSWNKTTKYFRKKMEAWGYKYGDQLRRAMRCNSDDIDNDLCYLIYNCLFCGLYECSSKTYSSIYVLRSWYNKDRLLFDWMFPRDFVSTAMSFAIACGFLGIILLFTYLIAGTCVAFFVTLSLLCASSLTAITFFIVFGIKLNTADKKVEARKLAIDNNKEDFHAEFIKSNMWWWLFPHEFMWTAISFAIAFSHFGAISLALYCTGTAFSGVLYFSLILAACSAVLFVIFGIKVWMKKKKYEDWISQLDKLQKDKKNSNELLDQKKFYDRFLANSQFLDNQNKKQNDSQTKINSKNEAQTK